MRNILHPFSRPTSSIVVALPFALPDMIAAWTGLRKAMARERLPVFTRDEWAYLMNFLSAENLMSPFLQEFGTPAPALKNSASRFFRPRGPVALWLPNNVSLLGPLSVVLLSLTGNPISVKAGSRSEDLLGAFLAFCKRHAAKGVLADVLHRVNVAQYDHEDGRNKSMSLQAKLRIAFGSDRACAEILSLPHSLDSVGIAFSDHQSQAWIEPKQMTPAVAIDLLKVFAVYGQLGCTSPHRVVLMGASAKKAEAFRITLLSVWKKVVPQALPEYIASENVMISQVAKVQGWDVALAPGNGALFALGTLQQEGLEGQRVLPIVTATLEQAIEHLPGNIQTIGYALNNPLGTPWLERLASTSVKRFVPISSMHRFAAVWDGWSFWRMGFEEVGL